MAAISLPPIPLKQVDLSTLPENIVKLLKDYRILSPDGRGITQEFLGTALGPKGKPLGAGPILDETVLARIIDADRTPDKQWVPWMLHMAGGGNEARQRSVDAAKQIKERFINDRVQGYTRKKIYYPPMLLPDGQPDLAGAEAKWQAEKGRFNSIIAIADQDMVEKFSVFGWHRHWPGPDRIYEKIVNAVTRFFKLRKKLISMNKYLQREGQTERLVPEDSKAYNQNEPRQAVIALEANLDRVERFFASRNVRRDKRADTIYQDENLRVIVPVTYAGAVEQGWNEWAWSNREQFEKGLEGTLSSYEDAWRKTGQDKIYVHLRFSSPMPGWVTASERPEAGRPFKRYYLTNLALELSAEDLKDFDPETVKLYDEENKSNLTVADIRKMILADVARPHDPETEEYPIYRGGGVYNKPEEAQAVLDSLEKGLAAIKAWGRGDKSFEEKPGVHRTFTRSKIVSNYLPARR